MLYWARMEIVGYIPFELPAAKGARPPSNKEKIQPLNKTWYLFTDGWRGTGVRRLLTFPCSTWMCTVVVSKTSYKSVVPGSILT